jgi:uncharacterized membrane protein YbhN (UPF0104 family)
MPVSSSDDSWLIRVVGRGHKVAMLVVAAALLAAGALAGMAWAAGFERAWQLLLHPHWPWLVVAVVAEAAAYLGYTLAYRDVVRADRGAELAVPRAAALVTTGFGVFLQGGGFALDREALKRAGLPEREARARVLGLAALEYSVLAPATAVAAAIVLARGLPIGTSLTLPWVIGVPVGAAVVLAARAHRRGFASGRCWPKPLEDSFRALELVLSLARSPRRYPSAVPGITLYWVGDVACLWATLHAFSARTPPVVPLLIGYATGYAITRRGLPLGGAGVVEALLPFALGWVGIPLVPAVLAVLAYRLINLWLPMMPAVAGLPTLARLEEASEPPSVEARRPRIDTAATHDSRLLLRSPRGRR